MGQVFTSYSRRDTETVDNIVGKLSQAGMSIWIDREAIKVRAIDTCDAFVVMLSGNSAASDNIRKEIDAWLRGTSGDSAASPRNSYNINIPPRYMLYNHIPDFRCKFENSILMH